MSAGSSHRRGFLRALAGATTAGSVGAIVGTYASAEAKGADTELLALRDPFIAAWQHEYEVGERVANDHSGEWDGTFEPAYLACHAIAEKIEALPATTMEGLGVKALVLSWTHSGQSICLDEMDWGSTTDMRLCAEILSTLINLTGGAEGGYPALADMSGSDADV